MNLQFCTEHISHDYEPNLEVKDILELKKKIPLVVNKKIFNKYPSPTIQCDLMQSKKLCDKGVFMGSDMVVIGWKHL